MELPWKYYPLRLLIALIPWKRLALEDLGDSEVKVTNTSTHKGQMQHTSHYVEFFTLRLFGQIEKMVRQSDDAARKFQVPAFVFYTPNDVFSSKEQVEHFFNQVASPNKAKHFFPNSYHLLLHDVDRDAAVKLLTEWLEQQTSRRVP
jgi:esterase/lipase